MIAQNRPQMTPAPNFLNKLHSSGRKVRAIAVHRKTQNTKIPVIQGWALMAFRKAGFVDSEGARFWSPEGTDFSQWEPPDLMVKAAVFLAAQTSSGVTGGIFTEKELAEKYKL